MTSWLNGTTAEERIMAKRVPRGANEGRGKAAKEEDSAADEPGGEDVDVSLKVPSRVHIFIGKNRPIASPKSGNKPLRRSLFGTTPRIYSRQGAAQSGVCGVMKPPAVSFNDEVMRIGCRIEKCKKILCAAAMKAEDVGALIQGLRRTYDRISKKRR